MTAAAAAPPVRRAARCAVAGAIAVLVVAARRARGARARSCATTAAGRQALRIAALPTDVAVLGDTVWVASGRDDRVVALEGGRADRAERHATGSAPLRVAVGAGSVWTANAGDDSVTRLNPLVPGDRRAADRDRRRRDRRRGRPGRRLGDERAARDRHADRLRLQPRARPADPDRRLPDRAGDRRQPRLGRQLRRRHGRPRRPARARRRRPAAAGRARPAGHRGRLRLGLGREPRRRDAHAALGGRRAPRRARRSGSAAPPGALAITARRACWCSTPRAARSCASTRDARRHRILRIPATLPRSPSARARPGSSTRAAAPSPGSRLIPLYSRPPRVLTW